MSKTDERIRKAAAELSEAISEGGKVGKEYSLDLVATNITALEDEEYRYVYRVHVTERTERRLAP